MEKVKYNVAYLFPYSMREKTTAHRRYQDDVQDVIKQERVKRMIEVFRKGAEELNTAQIDEIQIILIEGKSKRSDGMLTGRNEGNIKVIIPAVDIPTSCAKQSVGAISAGDYVAVKIDSANSQVLKGTPLFHTSLSSFDSSVLDFEDSK